MEQQGNTLASPQPPRFDPWQRGLMLRLAREAIISYLESGIETQPADDDFLKEPSGAFVTLKKAGILRGCIGAIESIYPLGETIVKCAVSSAVRDPRFPPLKKEEVDWVHLEISVISPMQPAGVDDISVGIHGVMIEWENRRGLLLPQVAVEQDWDRDTFLTHVCIKAGLNPDMWKHPEIMLKIFTAEIFGEEDSGLAR